MRATQPFFGFFMDISNLAFQLTFFEPMIRILICLCLVAVTLGGMAQNLNRFYENGKVGYRNTSGETVVDAHFDAGSEFQEGFAIVLVGSKRGYIDHSGKLAIPAQFEDAAPFCEGLASVSLGGKYGYITTSGHWHITNEFQKAESFSEGFALVSRNGKSFFIDGNGQQTFNLFFDQGRSFTEGFAAVKIGRWGYIDRSGKFVIKCQYDDAFPFTDGIAVVLEKGIRRYIDPKNHRKGTVIVPREAGIDGSKFLEEH